MAIDEQVLALAELGMRLALAEMAVTTNLPKCYAVPVLLGCAATAAQLDSMSEESFVAHARAAWHRKENVPPFVPAAQKEQPT